MPNWCSNALIVKGPKKALDAFKATLNTKDASGEVCKFSFAQTVPPPANMFRDSLGDKERKECEAKGIPNWYDWQSENWGCKWDACEARVKVTKQAVNVWFDTPWAPPIAWLEKASAAHPSLVFNLCYCEGGMGFYGVAVASNGSVSDNVTDFPKNTYDEDGEVTGEVAQFLEQNGLGIGG
jgi:hypothetical protein